MLRCKDINLQTQPTESWDPQWISSLSAENGKYLTFHWLCLFSYNNYEINVKSMCLSHIFFGLQSFRVLLPFSVASTLSCSIVWSADTQIIGLASKPHLDKLCGTCGGMPHCTVIWERKCKTHETWKGCNYCLRAVVRLRKVHFVLVVKDISFTEL